jgi:hypothetical protein
VWQAIGDLLGPRYCLPGIFYFIFLFFIFIFIFSNIIINNNNNNKIINNKIIMRVTLHFLLWASLWKQLKKLKKTSIGWR